MRRTTLPVLGLSLVILASCGGKTTVKYRLTFDSKDPAVMEDLTQAAIRVVTRRLDRLDSALAEQKITKDADSVALELQVSNGESAKALTQEMTAPFDLQVMVTTNDVEHADVTVEGYGAFNKTGVAATDISTIVAATADDKKSGMVKIHFTPAGLAKMQTIFKANVGKDLGLFVRGKLVSALTVQNATLPNPLVIDGIPDPDLASIFADDVNVGSHVTVTPL